MRGKENGRKRVEEKGLRRTTWPTFPFAKNQPWIKKASILLTNIHQYLLCGKVNFGEIESTQL